MGIDIALVMENSKDSANDFICSVCTELVESAVTLSTCQHNFCRNCIDGVIKTAEQFELTRCPDCRTPFSPSIDVAEPYRIMRQVMSRIQLNCPYPECNIMIGYDNFDQHKEQCDFGPNAVETCTYCTDEYHRNDEEKHKWECTPCLRLKVMELSTNLINVEKENDKLKTELITKTSPMIQLPADYQLILKIYPSLKSIIATMRVATTDVFDDSGRCETGNFDWYRCNSCDIMADGGSIRVIHGHDVFKDTSCGFFGLELERFDTTDKIVAEFRIKVWEKSENGKKILDDQTSMVTSSRLPTFTRIKITPTLKAPITTAEVTVSFTIKKWDVKKMPIKNHPSKPRKKQPIKNNLTTPITTPYDTNQTTMDNAASSNSICHPVNNTCRQLEKTEQFK